MDNLEIELLQKITNFSYECNIKHNCKKFFSSKQRLINHQMTSSASEFKKKRALVDIGIESIIEAKEQKLNEEQTV